MQHDSTFLQCMVVLLLLASVGCTQLPTPESTLPSITHDGLVSVDTRLLDAAYRRPGIEFSAYRQVQLGSLELAFQTPDRRQQQFALTEKQRKRLRQLLTDAFTAEFSANETLTLTDGPGADVLTLNARVQDISAKVSSTGSGPGQAAILLDALGEAVLILELRDSQSNEVLARGIDKQAAEGSAILQRGAPITRWPDIASVCDDWAAATRRALNALTR